MIAYIQIEGDIRGGHNKTERSGCLHEGLYASVVKTGHARRHIHEGKVPVESDCLDLSAASRSDPDIAGDFQFHAGIPVGVQGIEECEGRIRRAENPVVEFRNEAQQSALDVGYAADQQGFFTVC